MTLPNSSTPHAVRRDDDDDPAFRPNEDAAELSRDSDASDSTENGREEHEEKDYVGNLDLARLLELCGEMDDCISIVNDEFSSHAQSFGEGVHYKTEETDARACGGVVSGPAVAELIATRSELRRVESELQKVESERDAAFESQTRLQSDFDNFRKRSDRTRAEARQVLICEVVGRLLPVVDNFRRAVEARNAIDGDDVSQFVVGVELIRKQLDDVLCSYGVEPIRAVGEMFDPHHHEAIASEARDDVPPGTIIEEVVRGYRIGERLLRPATVKVAAAL